MDFGAVTGILGGIPFDWMMLGGLVILLALDSLRSGIGRAATIALALPVTLFLFSFLERTVVIGSSDVLSTYSWAGAAAFGMLFVISYLVVRRVALEYVESGTGEPIQALLAAVAATIVVLIVWLQMPMLSALWHFNPPITAAFAESYRLLWLVGAYAALVFARG